MAMHETREHGMYFVHDFRLKDGCVSTRLLERPLTEQEEKAVCPCPGCQREMRFIEMRHIGLPELYDNGDNLN